MNFTKQQFNKKFDKNYFELSNILEMNKKETTTPSKKEETKPSEENNTTPNENNNTNENRNNTTTNTTENTNTNTNNNDNNTTTNQKESPEGESQENTSTKTTANINDIVYPMYLPSNTYLTKQDTVQTKDGKRLILNFGGDSSFVLVEETANYENEGLIIPVSGEFDFLSDVIGVIGNKSLTWHSNGIDYYMTSDTLEVSELVEIAKSVSVLPVSK